MGAELVGFGEEVRRRRKIKRLSIEKLAELCNMSDRSVSNIEQGKTVPKLNTALQLCFACGIYVGELSNIDCTRKTK